MDTLRLLDILGFAVGLLYLILEYRASIWLWLAGVIMPAIDMALYYRTGLYADFGMAVYYCLAGAYGYLAWRFGFSFGTRRTNAGRPTSPERNIRRYPPQSILPSLGVFLLLWGAGPTPPSR